MCDYPLNSTPATKNQNVTRWVERIARLVQPARVHWVDGSDEEADALFKMMVDREHAIKLNEEKSDLSYWPNIVLRGMKSLHITFDKK